MIEVIEIIHFCSFYHLLIYDSQRRERNGINIIIIKFQRKQIYLQSDFLTNGIFSYFITI